jgi:murein DD-endopeptidase MepM/ murein hydrolase activator NlpD
MRTSRFPILFTAVVIFVVTISCSLTGGGSAPPTTEEMVPQPSTGEEAPQSSSGDDSQPPEIAETPAAPPSSSSQDDSVSEGLDGCSKPVCIQEGTFLLARPIGESGRFAIDTASRYGTLNKQTREMYHGVQFLNSTGTPVLAAAAGKVVVAGDDSKNAYGSNRNTYGNLVIIQHDLAGFGEPVFTLYAHLSEVSVQKDDSVDAGQQIGLVGSTGSVGGSTLYFEVRVGENSYDAARNPELWLTPLPDDAGAESGVLSGRVVDGEDAYVDISNITVEPVQKSVQALIKTLYLKTYLEQNARGLGPLNESFAAASLPEGSYQISFYYGSDLYQRVVEVQPGMVTYVTFTVK